MKTFKDIDLKAHPVFKDGVIGRINFDNGYGVSICNGSGAYTTKLNEYELAVLRNNHLCYSTPITDDVLGYLTEEEVTHEMRLVQNLQKG